MNLETCNKKKPTDQPGDLEGNNSNFSNEIDKV